MSFLRDRFQSVLVVLAAWCTLAIGSSQPTCAGLVGYDYLFSGIYVRGGSDEASDTIQGEFSTLFPDYGGVYTSHAANFDVATGGLKGSVGAGSSRARDARTSLAIYFDDLLYFTTTSPPPGRNEGDIPPGEFPGDGPQWATGSLNYHFSGRMSVSTSALSGPLYGPDYAQAALDMSILGINERLAFARIGSFPEMDVGLGVFDPDAGSETRAADILHDRTSAQFEIPSNVLLPIRLTLTLEAFTSNGGLASVDFMNTARLPTSGPVFNLPDGWTVNSLSGSIVNNQFVGVNAVPEPTSATLLGIGAVAAGGVGRVWRRRRAA